MTETYTTRHAETTTRKKEKEKNASFSDRYGRAIGKAGVSLLVGTQLYSAAMGAKDHGDVLHYPKQMLGIEQGADADTLREISDLMLHTAPGGPEMQKYENYRSVDAAANLRHETAAEYGLHDIDPRPAQSEILKAKNIDDIDRALEAFSQQAGIKVSLLKGDQDMSAQITQGKTHYMAKYLQTSATGDTFTMYKANVLNVLDGIASFPKEAFEETSDVLDHIELTAAIYTPDDHKGGLYIMDNKTIYLPLIWNKGDQADDTARHEFGHVIDHEMHRKGIINFYDDREFASIQSDTPNPDDEYASQYAKVGGGAPEDRAETLTYSFGELNPSVKLESGTAYNLKTSNSLQLKKALLFTRIDKLKPGMGKFLVKTAPYSANSALTYMPQLSE